MVFYLIIFYFVMYVYLLEAYYFLTETENEWIWSGGVVGKKWKEWRDGGLDTGEREKLIYLQWRK